MSPAYHNSAPTGRPTLFGRLESWALLVAIFVLCALARPLLRLPPRPPVRLHPSLKGTAMLTGKKTYITAVVAIVTAIGAYLAHDASLVDTAQMVFTALMAAFIRNGIKTSTGA